MSGELHAPALLNQVKESRCASDRTAFWRERSLVPGGRRAPTAVLEVSNLVSGDITVWMPYAVGVRTNELSKGCR